MATSESPSAFATIFVSSGRLCFGELHNIWNGATTPVQVPGLPTPRPRAFGTVKAQPIEYNIAARNGKWNAFQLVDLVTKQVTAWLLTHSDVDPEREVDKILRVSGSPYEPDSGSTFNDDKTAAEGVFVINRYDWGCHDKRSQDEVVEVNERELDPDTGNWPASWEGLFESTGLVDLAVAKPMVLQWKDQLSRERQSSEPSSEGGVWLHIPGGEYQFGRFGFDDDHAAAHSFLFFTTNTCFTRTVFKGLGQTLRREETPRERFERKLQEGFDFSGIEGLREISRVPEEAEGLLPLSQPRPPRAECLGPYPRSDHVLRAQEINAIRMDSKVCEFVEPWTEPLYDVVNEMVLSYLQRTVISHMGNRGVSAAAELLFPRHTQEGKSWSLDVWCYRHFTKPDALPIPGFDSAYVGSRIASFLSKFGDASEVVFQDGCVAGITRVVAYILAEVLESASRFSLDSGHTRIVPSDIRIAVYQDQELCERLQFARVYWEGRSSSGSPE